MEIGGFVLLAVIRVVHMYIISVLGHQYRRSVSSLRQQQLIGEAHLIAHDGMIPPAHDQVERERVRLQLASLIVALAFLYMLTAVWFVLTVTLPWWWQVAFMVLLPFYIHKGAPPGLRGRHWQVRLGGRGVTFWHAAIGWSSLLAFVPMLIWTVSPLVA